MFIWTIFGFKKNIFFRRVHNQGINNSLCENLLVHITHVMDTLIRCITITWFRKLLWRKKMLLLKKWSIYNILGKQCYGDNFLHTTYLLYWHSSSPAFKKLFPLCFSVSTSHLNPGALVDCKKVRGRYSIRQRTAVQRIFKGIFAWHFLLWIERFYTVHH